MVLPVDSVVHLGGVSPSDLLIKDTEVSGKHPLIKWNLDKMKLELVDMGSLNGTLLNSQPINHADAGNRHWGDSVDLANGDIITLGTTSKVIMWKDNYIDVKQNKSFSVEGVPTCKTKIRPIKAKRFPKKLFPDIIAKMLSNSCTRERVLSLGDASDTLRDAFSRTEACMNHHYGGCTATVLLVWADGDENFFAECASVGDSASILNVDGKQIKMTGDHKITSYSERLRMEETGEPWNDGETFLSRINLARMLGDKFLKEPDSRLSSEPYTSQVVHIDQASRPFAILAGDGLRDVISMKKAIQLVLQMRERYSTDRDKFAEKIANALLSEAKTLGTKDNSSVIFLDFDTASPGSHVKLNPSVN